MAHAINRIGQTFGRLTVKDQFIRRNAKGKTYSVAVCSCSCGNECEVDMTNLTHKWSHTQSCGCLKVRCGNRSVRTAAQREAIRLRQKGTTHSPEARKNMVEAQQKRFADPNERRKQAESQKGDKSHFWKGGKTAEADKVRTSFELRLWRDAVFARDDWTCQECAKRGGELNAHHIKAFARYPELRFDTTNGITLCVECHRTTENYGNKEANRRSNYG